MHESHPILETESCRIKDSTIVKRTGYEATQQTDRKKDDDKKQPNMRKEEVQLCNVHESHPILEIESCGIKDSTIIKRAAHEATQQIDGKKGDEIIAEVSGQTEPEEEV